MTAPDEARLRELAEALTFFGRYADETREATATRRNNNANDASKAILALLDALSAERERADDARTLLFDFAEMARVGYGGIPVMKSRRVNVPASLFHRVCAFLATQKAEKAET